MGIGNSVYQKHFKNKPLFVVESGGLDGEDGSNSLFFETYHKSKCLLVEPNPGYQRKIINRNRRCYLLKSALKPGDPKTSIVNEPETPSTSTNSSSDPNIDFA